MDYKERLREYIENDDIYTEYKSGKMDMSDFDKFCIKHCKDIECLLNEVQKYKDVIDKAIEYIESNPLVIIGDYDYFVNDLLQMEENCKKMSFIGTLLDILKEVVINE